jgi:hypothetical protein
LTVKVPEFLDELVFSFYLIPAHSPIPIHLGYSLRTGKWTSQCRNTSRGSLALSFVHSVLHMGDF